jgi:prephenate dehydratase
MRIAYQGEIGAYSEEAARAVFPNGKVVPLPTFDAVFEAIAEGSVDRGVVPIENSLHGSVHANYDLLREHEVHIIAELNLRIRHHLMAPAGATLESVQRVHSHPQALGQCREFLRTQLPKAKLVPSYDTAGAAKDVAGLGGTQDAAIASSSAVLEYGLSTLAAGIESNHLNFTRFLALTAGRSNLAMTDLPEQETEALRERWKTSILYAQRENIPGGLFKSLAVFALREIDLFKIESRPLVGSPGKYIFYLDLAGHVAEEPVRLALRHLEEVASYVQVLGSYPLGETIN